MIRPDLLKPGQAGSAVMWGSGLLGGCQSSASELVPVTWPGLSTGTPETARVTGGRTGHSFSPDQSRLYFSSQRGTAGDPADGMTFEIQRMF